jgi:hypothetical protein
MSWSYLGHDERQMGPNHADTQEERTLVFHGHVHGRNHLRCCVMVHKLIPGAVYRGAHVKIPTATAFPRISVIGRIISNGAIFPCWYSCVGAIGRILRPTQWLVLIQRMARVVKLRVTKRQVAATASARVSSQQLQRAGRAGRAKAVCRAKAVSLA